MAKKKKPRNHQVPAQNQPGQKNMQHMAAFFQGPLPPPSMLRGYNDIVSDAAERILKIAEEQSFHRMKMEEKLVQSNVVNERFGVISAFIIVVIAIIGGIIVILSNKSAEGISMIIGSLCALAAVFITGKYYQKKSKS